MPDDEERLHAWIPADLKQAIREADGSQKETVVEALNTYLSADFSTEEAYDRRIAQLEEEEEELVQKLESVQNRLEEVRAQKEEVVAQRDEYLAQRESFVQVIDSILDEMVAQPERSVFAWKEKLRQAAKQEYGRPTSENIQKVIEDAKERRDERGLAIDDSRFTDHMTNGQMAAQADGEGAPDADYDFDFDQEDDDGAE